MSLAEYKIVRTKYCSSVHNQPCTTCSCMLHVASLVLKQKFCLLHKAFTIVSSDSKYSSERAITKLLKMPLVAIRIGKPSSGSAFTILLEMFPGTDYAEMSHLLNQLVHNHADKSGTTLCIAVTQLSYITT